ncbi:hypothetical protein [Amycolatopsis sp. GA6-003]
MPVTAVDAASAPGRTERGGGHEFPDGWTDLLPQLNRRPGDKTVTEYS